MPMKLDDGWNQIQFNLSDFTRRAYGTNYIETLRISIHANCRIRRVYFSERLYNEEDLPDDFKLFAPKHLQNNSHNAPNKMLTSHQHEKVMNSVNSGAIFEPGQEGKENYYEEEEHDNIREIKEEKA